MRGRPAGTQGGADRSLRRCAEVPGARRLDLIANTRFPALPGFHRPSLASRLLDALDLHGVTVTAHALLT